MNGFHSQCTNVVWSNLAAKHGVSVEEAEEVLHAKPHLRKVGRDHVKGEHVYAAYGQSAIGSHFEKQR